MGEIIPSESLSRVTYTGIDGMHSQKTKQPNIRTARKNRTRKKSAVEDPPPHPPKKKSIKKKSKKSNQKQIPKMNNKNKPFQ